MPEQYGESQVVPRQGMPCVFALAAARRLHFGRYYREVPGLVQTSSEFTVRRVGALQPSYVAFHCSFFEICTANIQLIGLFLKKRAIFVNVKTRKDVGVSGLYGTQAVEIFRQDGADSEFLRGCTQSVCQPKHSFATDKVARERARDYPVPT